MPNSSNVKETIDERILRLLGLEDVFDLDYGTYLTLLKEAMVKGRMTNKSIPTEEVELLTNEYKRVKSKKDQGRFSVKKKKISTKSFNFSASQKRIKIENLLPAKSQQLYLPPAEKGNQQEVKSGSHIAEISKSLANIIKILNSSIRFDKKIEEKRRRERETSEREKEESNLEKGFKLVKKTLSKVLAPIKNILSSIIDFFMKMFLARVVYRLLEWMADPKNQDKLKSIFRFFGDHWPALLALYLRFGTGFGKFVGGLTKLVFFGTRKLLQVVAQLVGAKGAARFLGGKGGRLAAAGLSVATTVGTTMAVSKGIENFGGIGGEEKKTQGYSGGGFVIPKFAGGGLAKFKNLLGFFSGGLNSGYVSGQKGVDKVPAMLTDGEFVMSRGAVQKYGVNTLEAMNSAGGGTNKPKMISGIPHAAGGGLMGMQSDRGLSTRGVQVGATGLEKEGFNALKDAKSQHFGSKGLLSPGGKGVYSAPQVGQIGSGGLRPGYGASRYVQAGSNPLNSLMDMFRGSKPPVQPGGVLGSISPGGVRGTNLLEPQRVVNPRQFQKGQQLFQRIQGGKYPKSALANRLREQALTAGFKPGQVNIPFNQLPKSAANSGIMPKTLGLLRTGARVASAAAPLQLGIEGGMLLGDLAIKNKRGRDKEKEAQQESYIKTITGKNYDTSVSGMPAQLTQTKPRGFGENVKQAIHQSKNFLSGMFHTPGGVDTSKLGAGRKIEPQPSTSSKLNPAQIQTQNNISKINPPPNPKPVVVRSSVAGGMNGAMGGRSLSSNTPNSPKISASHPAGTKKQEATLGIRR